MSLISTYDNNFGIHAFIECDGFAVWLMITQCGLDNPPADDQEWGIVAGCWLGNVKEGVFNADECAPPVPSELIRENSPFIDEDSEFIIEFDHSMKVVRALVNREIYGYISIDKIILSNEIVGQKYSYSKYLSAVSEFGNPIK